MNLFATSDCPRESALALDDKRIGKMLMEANQMLSLAIKTHFYEDPRLMLIGPGQLTFGRAYHNHPVSIWVRRTSGNFLWAIKHARDLASEYRHRFGKDHASAERTEYIVERHLHVPPHGQLEPFQNSARNLSLGLDFTHIADPSLAYRMYLNARWKTDKRTPVWTRRGPPRWASIGACSAGAGVQV